MAGTSAILTLDAIGKQDTFLIGEDMSYWEYKPKQHTNFTLFYKHHSNIKKNDNPTWPFGETITFDINPRVSGDVMSNCFLKLTLPPGEYCSQVGRAIIKEYSFRVGDTVVQTLPNDWGIIHDELYASTEEQLAKRFLINGGQADDGTIINSSSPIPLYIPLDFFFSRFKTKFPGNWTNDTNLFKPYFLTCACTQQIITISVTFQPITFFSTLMTVDIPRVLLVTEEATLSPEEVNFYRENKQNLIYNTVSVQPKLRLDKGDGVINSSTIPSGCNDTFKNNLVSSLPVKSFHWFIREQKYEIVTDNTYYTNRFNFCATFNTPPSEEFKHHIMSDARIFINGSEQLGFKETNTKVIGASYYKYVQTQTHNYTTPKRNIYTYSFALNPKDPNPSGSLNFSVMDTSKTFLEGTMFNGTTSNSYNLNMFHLGYIILSYENDYCQLYFL